MDIEALTDNIEWVHELRHTKNLTQEILKEYYPKGLIPKSEYEDGEFYIGYCRNAWLARWDAKKNRFSHVRYKFGNFIETINCPEDDDGFDIFVPTARAKDHLHLSQVEEAIRKYHEVSST